MFSATLYWNDVWKYNSRSCILFNIHWKRTRDIIIIISFGNGMLSLRQRQNSNFQYDVVNCPIKMITLFSFCKFFLHNSATTTSIKINRLLLIYSFVCFRESILYRTFDKQKTDFLWKYYHKTFYKMEKWKMLQWNEPITYSLKFYLLFFTIYFHITWNTVRLYRKNEV